MLEGIPHDLQWGAALQLQIALAETARTQQALQLVGRQRRREPQRRVDASGELGELGVGGPVGCRVAPGQLLDRGDGAVHVPVGDQCPLATIEGNPVLYVGPDGPHPVPVELEIVPDRVVGSPPHEEGVQVVLERRKRHLIGGGSATQTRSRLEDQHALARLRQVGGAHEAVVPAADEDAVYLVG